jgi:hypothetical protein
MIDKSKYYWDDEKESEMNNNKLVGFGKSVLYIAACWGLVYLAVKWWVG